MYEAPLVMGLFSMLAWGVNTETTLVIKFYSAKCTHIYKYVNTHK